MFQISYKSIKYLVSSYYIPRSLNGYIDHCKQYFSKSLKVAAELDDKEYLNTVTSMSHVLSAKYDIFTIPQNLAPTTLEKDKPLGIPSFAKLIIDLEIPFDVASDLVESTARNKRVNIQEAKDYFKDLYDVELSFRRLLYEKIGRNEKCPCGSGKKYKDCHIDLFKR